MDRKYGIIQVLGEEHTPEDGFCIGGQIAAAGSNVHAAVRETKKREGLDFKTQWELATKVIQMRWADDNLQIWSTKISKPTKKALDEMAAEGFYGGNLQQLTSGPEENTSFGFRMQTTSGLVMTQAAKVYAKEKAGGGEETRWPHVHGGTQFCSKARKVAMIQGRILRELDLTNEVEAEVEKTVARVAFEMIVKAKYDRKTVTSAVTRAEKTAWVRMKDVKSAVRSWTDDEMETWCEKWDEEQRTKQLYERLEIAQEKKGFGRRRRKQKD